MKKQPINLPRLILIWEHYTVFAISLVNTLGNLLYTLQNSKVMKPDQITLYSWNSKYKSELQFGNYKRLCFVHFCWSHEKVPQISFSN